MIEDKERAEQVRMLRDSVQAFTAKRAPRAHARQWRERLPGFDLELWRTLADQGWSALSVPESLGGLGLGAFEVACVVDALAEQVLPEPYVPVAVFAARLLQECAEAPLARDCLADLIQGQALPAVAWQEDRTGALEAFASSTRLLPQGDSRYVLSGIKQHVRPGAGATSWLVTARTDEGVPVIVHLPPEGPGLEVFPALLADGTFEARLVFSHLPVTPAQILARGEAAERAFSAAYDEALVMSAVELLSLTRNMVSMTLEYIRVRHQFGRPIGSFQALQHRAVDLFLQQELGAAVVHEALAAIDEQMTAAERARRAARAKARASDVALHVGREAVQLHGAIGYTDEYDLSLFLKRALVLAAWLGNALQQRRRYATLDPELVPVEHGK